MARTLDELRAARPKVDRVRMAATTDDDIRRHAIEDGEDPDVKSGPLLHVYPALSVRKRLAMTQEAFATALAIPLATLRNWEQGRTRPDPAAQSLLRAVASNPEAVLSAIAGRTSDQRS